MLFQLQLNGLPSICRIWIVSILYHINCQDIWLCITILLFTVGQWYKCQTEWHHKCSSSEYWETLPVWIQCCLHYWLCLSVFPKLRPPGDIPSQAAWNCSCHQLTADRRYSTMGHHKNACCSSGCASEHRHMSCGYYFFWRSPVSCCNNPVHFSVHWPISNDSWNISH